MARYIGSKCRLCRRENTKLFLKGERCYTDSCAVDRRQYAPGDHGQNRVKYSAYGEQLREKQKVKRIYGVLEKQFRNYFHKAAQKKGVTGENLIVMLESRLDNMLYRLGFAGSRTEARQLIRHRHFTVNSRLVDIPSYIVKVGDVIQVREKSRSIARIKESVETAQQRGIPRWVEVESENFLGKVVALPTREEITMPIKEQLIVELYSK
ncbi:MAG: 30S ribosomal protein S4 [Deltaproteobacteria bacterium]|nr:30S ribosomal protein S4 [Deltaproteobacteria bacterium]